MYYHIMHIISILLPILSVVPSYGHTLLRGNLPIQQYITADDNNLLGTSWMATAIAYEDGLKPVLEDNPATLTFSNDSWPGRDDSSVSGDAGCNYFWGDVSFIPSSTIEFNNTMVTQMACFDDDVMDQETAFGDAIFWQSTVTYEITSTEDNDQVLTFFDGDTGDITARFVPLPEPTDDTNLLGTSWQIIEIAFDDGLRPVLEDYPANLIFSNDNTITAYAGCNQFQGELTPVNSSTFEVSGASMTTMGCFGNGLHDQDDALGNAIFWQSTVTYEITSTEENDQVLTFFGGDTGDITARLVPLPEPTLVGSKWSVGGVPNSWAATDKPMTLTFEDETKFSGYGGCNRFHGEWEDITEDDGHPLFRTTKFVSTKRGCVLPFPMDDEEEHIQAITEQERLFFDALTQDAVAYRVSFEWGGGLTLYDTDMGDSDETDSNDAPHSSLHVGRPLVRLSEHTPHSDN